MSSLGYIFLYYLLIKVTIASCLRRDALITSKLLPKPYTHKGSLTVTRRAKIINTILFKNFPTPRIFYQLQSRQNILSYWILANVAEVIAGVWYRYIFNRTESFIFLIGLSREKYRLIYGSDYYLTDYSDISHSIHEISFTFNIFNE